VGLADPEELSGFCAVNLTLVKLLKNVLDKGIG
jgi:hypothetical protein